MKFIIFQAINVILLIVLLFASGCAPMRDYSRMDAPWDPDYSKGDEESDEIRKDRRHDVWIGELIPSGD